MFLFVLINFGFRSAAAGSSSSGIVQATYNSNCELGKSYSVLAQSCGARAFDNFVEIDCEDADADTLYCIEKGTADTQQRQVEKKVSSTTHLEEFMSSMSTVSGTGWGVSLTASADYVSKNSASANSVSFYKTSTGDSYEKKIKYTERLTLNVAAKEKLMRNATQFVSDYGSHFISKIIYSNFFIGSVNVKQTSSESSASLGIMASLEVEKVFSGSASTTFNEAKESGSSYMDVTTDTSYNGPGPYVPADGLEAAEGVEDIFNQWRQNVIMAGSDESEQYAKPTRMVFSQWTELEEVQAMFSDTAFPEALTKDTPSATLQDYLFRDTIRTNADLNAIQNLLSWKCIGSTSSDMAIEIREIEAKLAAHAIALENMNEGMLALLEDLVTSQPATLTWFVGYTAEHLGEVNALLGASDQCKKVWISEDYTIYPWGRPGGGTRLERVWGPVYNKLMMPEAGSDAFLRGFHFTAGRLNMESIGVEGQTIGYQVIKSEVNGGNMHETQKSVWKHYDGKDDLSSQKTFELTCAKEGMYVAGIDVDWSEVLCACATPNKGGSGDNQRQCTDGSVTWCNSNEKCTKEQAIKESNINALCGSRRRVSDPLRRLEDEIDAYGLTVGNSAADGNTYGRLISMTLHCVPLPKGNYGLPSGPATNHGPYTLKNQASTSASKDCPDGSAIFHVDWMGVARAENDDTSQTENDAAWTIASEIKFYCRDFADFMA